MTYKIISFGEALWDLLPTGPTLGGAPLNLAYRVKAFGDEGVLISRLGKDKLGKDAFERIIELGMESTFFQWDEVHPTGTVEIRLDEEKNPDYTIVENVAYDFIEMDDALSDLVRSADCLCFGTVAQRRDVSRTTLAGLLDSFAVRSAFWT